MAIRTAGAASSSVPQPRSAKTAPSVESRFKLPWPSSSPSSTPASAPQTPVSRRHDPSSVRGASLHATPKGKPMHATRLADSADDDHDESSVEVGSPTLSGRASSGGRASSARAYSIAARQAAAESVRGSSPGTSDDEDDGDRQPSKPRAAAITDVQRTEETPMFSGLPHGHVPTKQGGTRKRMLFRCLPFGAGVWWSREPDQKVPRVVV